MSVGIGRGVRVTALEGGNQGAAVDLASANLQGLGDPGKGKMETVRKAWRLSFLPPFYLCAPVLLGPALEVGKGSREFSLQGSKSFL